MDKHMWVMVYCGESFDKIEMVCQVFVSKRDAIDYFVYSVGNVFIGDTTDDVIDIRIGSDLRLHYQLHKVISNV